MPANYQSRTNRLDLESRVLAAALKQSVDRDDKRGVELAYKELSNLLKRQKTIFNQQKNVKSPIDQKTVSKTTPIADVGIYELLGDNPLSSFKEIHTHFLAKLRKLLLSSKEENGITKQLHNELIQTWVAHDILHNPATRTDYDLRRLGVRTPAQSQNGKLSDQAPLTVNELVQCLKLIEGGVLSNEELDSLLIGQRLVQQGKISIEQFRTCMLSAHTDGKSFTRNLMDSNWIQDSEIAEPEKQTTLAPVYKMPAPLTPGPLKQLDICKSSPSWANQLIWDEEDSATQASDKDSAASNDSKKSARKKKKHKSKS